MCVEKNDDMLRADLPDQLLNLQRNDHIEGGQRLVEQDDRRAGNHEAKHLHFILHAVGIAFDEPITVLSVDFYQIEIIVDRLIGSNFIAVDLHKKF